MKHRLPAENRTFRISSQVPIEVIHRVSFVPTEAELAAHPAAGARLGMSAAGGAGIGRHSPWIRGSRPASFAFGALFWNVSSDRRGYAYAHDAEHSAQGHPRREFDRRCPSSWSPSSYLSTRMRYGYHHPRLWQCHHSSWQAMLRDHTALALQSAALGGCTEYNQAHLSWETPGLHGAKALFYVNDSFRWSGLQSSSGGGGGSSPRGNRPPQPTIARHLARLTSTPEHWPSSTTKTHEAAARSAALHAAALDVAKRALERVSYVQRHVVGYEALPIIQLRLDSPCSARPLLQRLAAGPDTADGRRAARLAFISAASPSIPAADGWLGDTDAIGPRSRCNLTILKAVLVSLCDTRGSSLDPCTHSLIPASPCVSAPSPLGVDRRAHPGRVCRDRTIATTPIGASSGDQRTARAGRCRSAGMLQA